jgi:protocatechuate 3,4-dioxygenase beta subunit
MRNINYDNITETVVNAYSGTADERTREILALLIRRLHDFVREVKLTPEEWEKAMGFLLRAAETSSEQRNEFILLSDLLGVSALVDLQEGKDDEGATITTLIGPFYVPGQPDKETGADLIKDNPGERVLVQGQVRSANGGPLPGAILEIWQNGPNGLYTVQDPDQPDDNLRCTLRADEQGNYRFSTVKPVSYTIPDDGAGGELVRAAGRHCWRPAHIHVMISADGHKRHISQIFNEADAYIDEDAVFGVRADLAVPFDGEPTAEELARFPNIERPFNVVNMDFVLARSD